MDGFPAFTLQAEATGAAEVGPSILEMTLKVTEKALLCELNLRRAMVYQELTSAHAWVWTMMTCKCLMSSSCRIQFGIHLGERSGSLATGNAVLYLLAHLFPSACLLSFRMQLP